MKNNGKITSLISLLSLVVILSASNGFTVITRSCQLSADESLSTYILSATKVDSCSCCLTPDCYSDQYQTEEEPEHCCSYQHQEVKNLKTCCKSEIIFITVNFFMPKVTKVTPPELVTFPANHPGLTFTILKENPVSPFSGLEKYGGRSITTIHRQLII